MDYVDAPEQSQQKTLPSKRHRFWITIAALSGLFLSALEMNVVGTAAPLIVKDLGGFEYFGWLFAIYLLTSTLAMPFWGRACDHWGRSATFQAALGFFMLGSVVCALAPSFWILVIGRAIQGLGSGGLLPISFTLVTDVHDMKTRTKLQAVLSGIWGIANALGPFLGGYLAETLSWRLIFWFNLFPGLASSVLTYKFFSVIRWEKTEFKLGPWSFLLSIGFVTPLVVAASLKNPKHAILTACFGVIMAVLFFLREYRSKWPLIPVVLYKNRLFFLSCLSGFLSTTLVVGLSAYLPFYFQMTQNTSPTLSGLLLLPFTVSWLLFSGVSAPLMMRISYRTLVALGMNASLAGCLLFLYYFDQMNITLSCVATSLMGAGMAFNFTVVMIATQYSVPRNLLSSATSGIFWIRNIGGAVGTALMGLVLVLTTKNKIAAMTFPDALLGAKEKILQNPDLIVQADTTKELFGNALPLIQKAVADGIFASFLVFSIGIFLSWFTIAFFPKQTLKDQQT
ncbi:MAG: MFS transporter [Deltaproteobacteria bacterium]|nr:MFS transporter [Deltaproteobacteria bacterium]